MAEGAELSEEVSGATIVALSSSWGKAEADVGSGKEEAACKYGKERRRMAMPMTSATIAAAARSEVEGRCGILVMGAIISPNRQVAKPIARAHKVWPKQQTGV